MSRDDRDQKGGHPLRHPSMLDCMCCDATTKHDTVRGTRARQRELAIAEQLESGVEPDWDCAHHVFIEHRCLRCGVNDLDAELYGVECSQGPAVHYRTETPKESVRPWH